jgi:hypothetical protein
MALATKLRITAQAQVYPEFAGRKRPLVMPSYYDTMEANDELISHPLSGMRWRQLGPQRFAPSTRM